MTNIVYMKYLKYAHSQRHGRLEVTRVEKGMGSYHLIDKASVW